MHAVLTRLTGAVRRRPAGGAAPARTPEDRCGADDCRADDNPFPQAFPVTGKELARCEVPAADETKSGLQPTTAVADARPDLIPVWCHTCSARFHSAPCYSTHHHADWTPARDKPIGRRGRRPGRPGRKGN